MKRLAVMMACGVMAMSAFAQDGQEKQAETPSQKAAAPQVATNVAAKKKHLTTVLGVTMGMTMAETLKELQARSKRFHMSPHIGADDSSLALITDLQLSEVRLGWHDDVEMMAKGVRISFYRGKVVRILVMGSSQGMDHTWKAFLEKIPKAKDDVVDKMSQRGGVIINPIEHCIIDEDDHTLLLRDTDNWNAYVEEKRQLEEFFKNVSRADEVLD